ncbi:MAG: hypothetical protein O7B99_00935 [Planctomycetota bacterium]|nr:hypothetical protein [Planctomycetota bacterium]
MIDVLKWIGIAGLLLFGLAVLIGFGLGIFRVIQEARSGETGSTGFGTIAKRVQDEMAKRLRPWQVGMVALWYAICLGCLIHLLYALGLDPQPHKILAQVKGSDTARFLVQCFASGGIGAIVYGILWISKANVEEEQRWMLRRFLFLPILGSFLGGASYLFVKAGLLTLQSSGGQAGGASGDGSSSDFAIYIIAFLSGFASRELTAKLIQIAEAVFTKAPETSPTRTHGAGEDDGD